MKILLAVTLLCGLISQGFSYPRYKPVYDKDNGFKDYMTDDNYGEADPAWAGYYDKEETLVNQDPNSVWPQPNFQDKERDDSVEGSGWYGIMDDEWDDDEDSSSRDDDSYEDSYEVNDDMYDNEVDYIEDELDYVEEDVEFNDDRIYELEDDLDYDEQKIERMDKRIRKLNKNLQTLQNLVNAMETERLEDSPQKRPYYVPRDADF